MQAWPALLVDQMKSVEFCMENVFWRWSVVNHPNLHGECFWRCSVFGDGVFLEMECFWILIVDNVVWRWSGVFCKWHDQI